MNTQIETTAKSFTVTSTLIARYNQIKHNRMILRILVVAANVGIMFYFNAVISATLLNLAVGILVPFLFINRYGSSIQSEAVFYIERKLNEKFLSFSGARSLPPVKKMLAGNFRFDVINADTSSTRWLTKCADNSMTIVQMRHKY